MNWEAGVTGWVAGVNDAADMTKPDNPGDALLVRLMRYHDGDLSAHERAEVEEDLRRHPDWQALLEDIVQGTQLAQLALQPAMRREMKSNVMSLRPGQRAFRHLFAAAGYRQAAALLIGLGLGVAGVHLTMNENSADTTLHLAGLPAASDPVDARQRALQRALGRLLQQPLGQSQQTAINDSVADLHGSLATMAHFDLGNEMPCVTFAFVPAQLGIARIDGVACRQSAGDWQVMTIPADH